MKEKNEYEFPKILELQFTQAFEIPKSKSVKLVTYVEDKLIVEEVAPTDVPDRTGAQFEWADSIMLEKDIIPSKCLVPIRYLNKNEFQNFFL